MNQFQETTTLVLAQGTSPHVLKSEEPFKVMVIPAEATALGIHRYELHGPAEIIHEVPSRPSGQERKAHAGILLKPGFKTSIPQVEFNPFSRSVVRAVD